MGAWKLPIGSPSNVAIVVFVKNERRKDLLNLMAGPMDALVKAKILEDDCWKIARSHDGSGVYVDPIERCEITITPAAVTTTNE